MALPKLTDEQRKEALEKATAARRRRAEVKASLKNRELSLDEVFKLAEEDEAVAKMRVQALLESLPRVGVHRARALMEEIGIADSRRIRGLGPVQRSELDSRFS